MRLRRTRGKTLDKIGDKSGFELITLTFEDQFDHNTFAQTLSVAEPLCEVRQILLRGGIHFAEVFAVFFHFLQEIVVSAASVEDLHRIDQAVHIEVEN